VSPPATLATRVFSVFAQRAVPHRVVWRKKNRVLVLRAADHDRDGVGQIGRRRVKWVAQQIMALDHWAESIAVKQPVGRRTQLLLGRLDRREQSRDRQRLQTKNMTSR
jgi:hypothetical protein